MKMMRRWTIAVASITFQTLLLQTLVAGFQFPKSKPNIFFQFQSTLRQRDQHYLHFRNHQLRSHPNDDTNEISSLRETTIIDRRDLLKSTALTAVTAATTSISTPSHAADVESTTTTSSATTTEPSIPTTQLKSLTLPRTIQGQWQLAGGHGKYDADDALDNMDACYKAGMFALDTADIYGPSEILVGKFVGEKVKELGKDALVIPCTKFCCFRYLEEIDKDEVKTRIDQQRERLQVDTIPLLQFFWSDFTVNRYVDVALHLADLQSQGYIHQIGVTNFDLPHLKELIAADIPIVSNQVQLSALDRRPIQSGMSTWCSQNDMNLLAYGTVGGGILTDRFLGQTSPPTPKDRRGNASLRMYGKTAERFGSWDLVQTLLRTMGDVASRVRADGRCVEATVANVAQRYVLDGTPSVASILIGVRNQDHIQENVRTHSFLLTQEEIQMIDAVVDKRIGPVGDVWGIERDDLAAATRKKKGE